LRQYSFCSNDAVGTVSTDVTFVAVGGEMKKLLVFTVLLLGCLCFAQETQYDYPAGILIRFSDGNKIQLSCTPDGLCQVYQGGTNNEVLPVTITRINLGMSTKGHGYTLLVK
ncbi:MAG: hypothetical protein WAM78_14865, partial [Candidatus Sulfotelmatobacter sp.]